MFNRNTRKAIGYAGIAVLSVAAFLLVSGMLVYVSYALVNDPSESEVVRIPDSDIHATLERSAARTFVASYRVKVLYWFTFEGVQYSGTRIFPYEWSDESWNKPEAETIASRLTASRTVIVPHSNPARAFLEYRSGRNWTTWFLSFAFWVPVCLMIMFRSIAKARVVWAGRNEIPFGRGA